MTPDSVSTRPVFVLMFNGALLTVSAITEGKMVITMPTLVCAANISICSRIESTQGPVRCCSHGYKGSTVQNLVGVHGSCRYARGIKALKDLQLRSCTRAGRGDHFLLVSVKLQYLTPTSTFAINQYANYLYQMGIFDILLVFPGTSEETSR